MSTTPPAEPDDVTTNAVPPGLPRDLADALTDAHLAGEAVAGDVGLREDATKVATGLRITSTVLAVPAAMVSGAAFVGLLVLTILVGVALADTTSVLRWVLLALAVAGLVATVAFAIRVVATWRAARDRDALAGELIGLVDLRAVTTAMIADLAELTSREGGLRAVSRARALWRVLRRLDVGEHTSQFERAKWFVPPEIATTWALAQAVTWAGLVAWILVPTFAATRAAGWV